MLIHIVRHAIAVPHGDVEPDSERPLTSKGRRRFVEVVRGLSVLSVKLDFIYESPWRRARETADLLARLLEGPRIVTEMLATAPSHALLDGLKGRSIAIVGHEPWLSELTGMLLCKGAPKIELKKGAVAILEGEPTVGGATLKALYPPSALRRIS